MPKVLDVRVPAETAVQRIIDFPDNIVVNAGESRIVSIGVLSGAHRGKITYRLTRPRPPQ